MGDVCSVVWFCSSVENSSFAAQNSNNTPSILWLYKEIRGSISSSSRCFFFFLLDKLKKKSLSKFKVCFGSIQGLFFLLLCCYLSCLVCSAAVNHLSVVSSDVKVASGGLWRGHVCGQLGFQRCTSSRGCSTDPGSEPSSLAANNIISPSFCNQ